MHIHTQDQQQILFQNFDDDLKPSIVLLNTSMPFPDVFIPQPDECFRQTAPSIFLKLFSFK